MLLKFKPPVAKYRKTLAPSDFADLEEFDPVTWGPENDYTAELPDQLGRVIVKRDTRFTEVAPDAIDESIDDTDLTSELDEEPSENPEPPNEGD